MPRTILLYCDPNTSSHNPKRSRSSLTLGLRYLVHGGVSQSGLVLILRTRSETEDSSGELRVPSQRGQTLTLRSQSIFLFTFLIKLFPHFCLISKYTVGNILKILYFCISDIFLKVFAFSICFCVCMYFLSLIRLHFLFNLSTVRVKSPAKNVFARDRTGDLLCVRQM